MTKQIDTEKRKVYDFWNRASCGEELFLAGKDRTDFDLQFNERYRLEPYILEFAQFETTRGLRLLEIGVGLGADHQRFAEAGAELYGIDLTERAVSNTRSRLTLFNLKSNLSTGDAEHLVFLNDYFDLVYSWGVLHHSPDTLKAVNEVHRVLKRGGVAKIMIYHKWSMVGLMLWLRYALFVGRPWQSLSSIYAKYLESPGTKAYSVDEAKTLFHSFSVVRCRTVLSHGDLLESRAGQRHSGLLLSLARRIWPRWIIRKLFPKAGLFMLIEAIK